MTTLGLVANVYNEVNALPGWLETHTPFFDDIRVYHSGPQGAYSDDGTIELLERWHIPIIFGSIDEGFGTIRTKAIHASPCDYVMLLDADERFYQHIPVLTCCGESTPPDQVDALLYDYSNPNFAKDGPKLQSYDATIDFSAVPSNFENMSLLGAKLSVSAGELYDQGAYLRSLLPSNAIRVIRRHWHDFSFRRPTQNWHTDPDYQTRIVRRSDDIRYDAGVKMHERLNVGALNSPNFTQGPFFDHFHLWFKRMEVTQRGHDIAIYTALDRGEAPPTRDEFLAR